MKNSDVYIMVPVTGRINTGLLDGLHKNSQIEMFLNKLKETSIYECDNKVSNSLERYNYGSIKISYYKNDNYEEKDIEWVNADIIYTFNKATELGILQFIITSFDKDDSQLGDIISSRHLQIKINDQSYRLDDLLKDLSLSQCGKIRTINCNSIGSKDKTMKYTLIAETSNSEHNPYSINEKYFENIGDKNYSKYDFYELYASEKTVVYLLKEFSNKYEENIEDETLISFICEIAILQNAAISRINSEIIDKLIRTKSKISPVESLKLQREYGKTILFWNNNIFNYQAAQDLSNDIVDAFKTKELVSEYEKNSKYLDQISNLASSIGQKRQSLVVGIAGAVITINNIYMAVLNIRKAITGRELFIGLIVSSIILLYIFVILIRNCIDEKRG